MTITIADVSWDYTSMWVTGIIWALLIVWAIVYAVLGYRDVWDDRGTGAAWALAIFGGAVIFVLFGILVGGGLYEAAVAEAKVAALEDIGFSRIDLGVNEFTASLEGEYFEGVLYHLDGNTYQVNEIVELKR